VIFYHEKWQLSRPTPPLRELRRSLSVEVHGSYFLLRSLCPSCRPLAQNEGARHYCGRNSHDANAKSDRVLQETPKWVHNFFDTEIWRKCRSAMIIRGSGFRQLNGFIPAKV